MRAVSSIKHWEFRFRIFFLFVVFMVLLISIFEFLSITETATFDWDFEFNSGIFNFIIPYLLGWVFFISAIAFFIFDQKCKQTTPFPTTLGLVACMVSTSYYSTFPSSLIHTIWLVSVLLLSISFYFQFIHGLTKKNIYTRIKLAVFILSLLVVIIFFFQSFSTQQFPQIFPGNIIIFWSGILLGLALIFGFGHILIKGEKKQLQREDISTIGFVLCWAPFCGLLFQKAYESISPMTPWILLQISIYPIFIGGVIIFSEKRRKFSIEDEGNTNSLDKKNKVIYPEKNDDTYEELRQQITELTYTKLYHHFIFEPTNNEYYAYPFLSGKTTDLRFSADSDFVQYLVKNQSPLIISGFDQLPSELSFGKDKLKLLAANCFIPIYLKNRLEGWLAFTLDNPIPSENDRLLTSIEPLIGKFSKSYENRQHHLDLEQRVSDMNVLNRIVQGVNYTLALDDIFELIYAQTTQVIPAKDFYIVLKDHQTLSIRYVFFVEKDERVSEKENFLLQQSQYLETLVIENGRGLIINNYVEYCLSQNYQVLYSGLTAAMLVPLNTGAITNGCILIGERDPNNKFTENQLTLAQSIADLVAGAIEKARLMEETEQYVRQLAILNDLTRQLTSTLEVEELYKTILQSSVDMVKCEDARLIILEDKTQDLIYQAVIGNKSNELLLRKVPIDHDLIRESLRSRIPILINKKDSDKKLSEELNSFYARPIHSLMIIPMVLKNQVIGLIEMVNDQDGMSFTKNDQELISALAAQAAIALENARLYRRTDQELAKRVEELSVMQRIDRELNTSLDMKKAMEITLTWAIRQSGCDVGWIGLISDSKIEFMALSGYSPNQLSQFENKFSFSDILRLDLERFSSKPTQIQVNGSTQCHPDAFTQIILPIRRNEKIIAIMMLEQFDDRYLDENEINFLTRLCEHASIAIVNSQLYAEVQAANQAKSEFVALVAHELKNPMTSIKGYTELLATGTVGPISPAQANFLSTIRNNTDRMNTLVSDLNDLTKIEAGSMRMEPKTLDLKEIMNELVRSTRRQLEEKQQSLHLVMDDELSEVWADLNRILQILTNLISNAHKYTQKNGEISIITEKTIDHWGSDPSKWVAHIMVRDNGLGISEEDQKMIFQKFFRSENAEIRASSGTGLGLNITRSLVEMQGGSIWFESEYKKGTTFHFTLPLAESTIK